MRSWHYCIKMLSTALASIMTRPTRPQSSAVRIGLRLVRFSSPTSMVYLHTSEYQHALANFTFTDQYAPNKTMFGATFDQPEIKFICDHDAILHLKVKNCSYRLDYSKSSTMKYSGK